MLETVTKRLYVGGLANDVSAEEISDRFSRFGKVSNLKLTTRTDDLGNKLKSFAHLDLEGDETSIKKCFSTYQNAKWKGTVLQLQYAKESFLQKLEKEIHEAHSQKEVIADAQQTPSSQKFQPELFEVKGPAVPGTPVPGKKDWVVGKYGRVLPVLKLKKSYKIKMMKYDPSKHCHAAKVFKDDKVTAPSEPSCEKLTWEMNVPDTEITKKRKGEYPDVPKSTKKVKVDIHSLPEFSKNSNQLHKKDSDDVEIVKVGIGSSNMATKVNRSNRFDSDIESGSEDAHSFEDVNAGLKTKKLKLSEKSVLANKNSHLKTVSKPNNSNSEHTVVKPTNKSSDIKHMLKLANRTRDIITSEGIVKMKSLNMSKPEIQNSAVTKAKPSIKNNEIIPDSKILTTNVEPSSLGSQDTAVKVCNNKFTGLGSLQKVPEFRGLGMLGLLPQCSEIAETRTERTPVQPNSSVDDPSKISHVIGNKTSPGRNNSSPQLNQNRSKLKDKFNRSSQKPSDNFKEKLLTLKNTPPVPSMLLSDSVMDHGDSKNCDSSSSADTDEIIARCKQNKGLTLSPELASGLPLGNGNTSSTTGKSLQQQKCKNVRSLVDHNLELSEFTAGISEDQPLSRGDIAAQDDTSDSYDSDLDSNDFALVAKKLAQKALTEKKTDLGDKVKGKITLGPSNPDISRQGHQNKNVAQNNKETQNKKDTQNNKETLNNKESITAAGLVTAAVAPVKPKPPATNKSSIRDTPGSSRQVADNEKRLQAIKENMKLKQMQHSISQIALKNVDSKECSFGKRVVFSSSDDDGDETSDKDETPKHNEKPKMTLFDSSEDEDDDDEDYAEIFKSKPHFEGQKGEKLMRLEQKIADPRFKLDAKFAVSDSDDEEDEEFKKTSNITEVSKSLEEEKTANLKVLENVVGKTTLDRFSDKLKRNTKHIIDMNTVRFDPTKLKMEVQSVSDRKSAQGKILDNSGDHNSVKLSKTQDVQRQNKIVDNCKKQDQKSDSVKKITTVGSEKMLKETSDTKKKVKSEKSHMKNAENSAVASNKVQLSTSLVDLFKMKNDSKLINKESEPFSLLQQFDMGEADSDDDGESIPNPKGLTSESKAPLSALFKKQAQNAEPKYEKKQASAKPSSAQSEGNSSSDLEKA